MDTALQNTAARARRDSTAQRNAQGDRGLAASLHLPTYLQVSRSEHKAAPKPVKGTTEKVTTPSRSQKIFTENLLARIFVLTFPSCNTVKLYI